MDSKPIISLVIMKKKIISRLEISLKYYSSIFLIIIEEFLRSSCEM